MTSNFRNNTTSPMTFEAILSFGIAIYVNVAVMFWKRGNFFKFSFYCHIQFVTNECRVAIQSWVVGKLIPVWYPNIITTNSIQTLNWDTLQEEKSSLEFNICDFTNGKFALFKIPLIISFFRNLPMIASMIEIQKSKLHVDSILFCELNLSVTGREIKFRVYFYPVG